MNKRLTENDKTELKAVLNNKLERSVVAFLNSRTGGDIYIGVNDDGSAVEQRNIDKTQLVVSDRIKNNILPTTLGLFEVTTEEYLGKIIIHVIVSSGTEKPYYIKQMGMSPSGCFIRIGSGVQQMTNEIIDRLYASRTRNSLRNIVSPRYTDHNFAQIKIYYQEKGFEVNDLLLHNLDFYTLDGKLNYVAYLFADTNSVSIKVAKYSGKDKYNLIENEEYGYCSLIKATQRVLDKLDVENRTFTKITGNARRSERSLIDRTALREALINAIVHNDYTREVPPVVEIYSDRLTITSYGGLVEGLSKEEFFSGRSMPRNREIMRIFKDLELVEQLGSGMNRILKVYKRDIFKISDNFIQIVFPFEEGYYETDMESKKTKKEQVREQVGEQVGEQLIIILKHLSGELTTNELMKQLGFSGRRNFIYKYLQPAINNGYIEMTIPDKPNSRLQKYRLTKKGETLKKKFRNN